MDGDHILAVYQDISRITQQMLAAARGNDWEQLETLEQECGTRFQALLAAEDCRPRDAEFQRRKAALIRRVLDDDAQIRNIVEPWRTKLGALIFDSHQQKRLADAYRADG